MGGRGLDAPGLRQRLVADCCQHWNGPLNFIKCGKFLV